MKDRERRVREWLRRYDSGRGTPGQRTIIDRPDDELEHYWHVRDLVTVIDDLRRQLGEVRAAVKEEL